MYRKIYSTDERIIGTSAQKHDGFTRMISECEDGKINLDKYNRFRRTVMNIQLKLRQ